RLAAPPVDSIMGFCPSVWRSTAIGGSAGGREVETSRETGGGSSSETRAPRVRPWRSRAIHGRRGRNHQKVRDRLLSGPTSSDAASLNTKPSGWNLIVFPPTTNSPKFRGFAECTPWMRKSCVSKQISGLPPVPAARNFWKFCAVTFALLRADQFVYRRYS